MAEALELLDDPIMFGPQQLVSSTKLVRNMSSYLNMAQKKPIFVERDQEVQAVLLSVDEYRALLIEEAKTEELYQTTKALRRMLEVACNKIEPVNVDELIDIPS